MIQPVVIANSINVSKSKRFPTKSCRQEEEECKRRKKNSETCKEEEDAFVDPNETRETKGQNHHSVTLKNEESKGTLYLSGM